MSLKLGPVESRVLTGTVTSPAVKLSPNARNLVRDSRGTGGVMVTVNVQLVVSVAAVAVQRTWVAPTGNSDADGGVQATVARDVPSARTAPPVVVAAGYVTITGLPFGDAAACGGGHEIVRGWVVGAGGAVVGGGVGAVGDEQPIMSATRSGPTAARADCRSLSLAII